MFTNRRKLILISSTILALVLVSIFVWFGFRNKRVALDATRTATEAELFPSGEFLPSQDTLNLNNASSTTPIEEAPTSDATGRFYSVSTRPVGGLVLVGQATSSSLIYVEKTTGHLYRLRPGIAAERISNTTIPKVQWVSGGQSGTSTTLILRHPRDGRLQTFLGNIALQPTSAGDNFLTNPDENLPPLEGALRSPEILSLAVSPTQEQFVWLEPSGNESVLYLANLDGSQQETLFRSPYSEWQIAWASSTTLALQSRTSALANGSLYFWNLRTKAFQPIITNVLGLSTLVGPDLNQILYSGLGEQGLVFGVYNRVSKLFGRLSIRTWPEKCVWSRDGVVAYCAVPNNLSNAYRYPDDWYRGEVTINDNIWKIDTVSGQNEIIFSPTTANLNISLDAEKLLLNEEETTLYLTNRYDQRLWALTLHETLGSGE